MKEIIMNPIMKKVADSMNTISSSKIYNSVGIVESYREESNTLQIICSVNGSDKRYLSVPIIFSPSSKTIFNAGDNVFVMFLYNDIDFPVVMGKIDEAYAINSRETFNENYINL